MNNGESSAAQEAGISSVSQCVCVFVTNVCLHLQRSTGGRKKKE